MHDYTFQRSDVYPTQNPLESLFYCFHVICSLSDFESWVFISCKQIQVEILKKKDLKYLTLDVMGLCQILVSPFKLSY